jgi:hypothetical protein
MDNMSKILESIATLDLDAAAAAIESNKGNGTFSVVCASLSFEVTLTLCSKEFSEDQQELEMFIEELFRD